MKNFLNFTNFQRRELGSLLLCLLFGFLFGLLLMGIILAVDGGSWVPIGTILALGCLVLFTIVCYVQFNQQFMLALSMGRTRKEFLLFFGIRHTLWALIALLLLPVLELAEKGIYALLFPDAWCELLFSDFLPWHWLLPAAPFLALVTMFLGSLYSRYGKRFNVVLYIVWMSTCILLPQAINHIDRLPLPVARFFDLLFALPPAFWLTLSVAAIAAMVLTTIHLGKKQAVR